MFARPYFSMRGDNLPQQTIIFKGELWQELQTILKLYAHGKSAKKIGNTAEAKVYMKKADALMIAWGRKLVIT